MKINTDEVNKAYERLPDNLKQIFDSKETSTTLINIGKKYNLHVDQLGQLTSLVHYVLLGFLAPQNFVQELKNSVGVSEDIANLITYDLNQKILIQIRQELEELSVQGLPLETLAAAVFNEKMQGVANVPKQEVAVTPQTGDNKVRDPYRESI
ncbi:MAG: hypothetical protein WC531_02695 [Candidatus Paceibacterota bacterium]|jgi:hypothetical protein